MKCYFQPYTVKMTDMTSTIIRHLSLAPNKQTAPVFLDVCIQYLIDNLALSKGQHSKATIGTF